METSGDVPHVQAKFITKIKHLSLPDSPFSIPTTVGVQELDSLLNSLLVQDGVTQKPVNFDFLVAGEFLRIPLDQHLQQKAISTETVVEIEYIEKHPAPEPEDFIVHDDWVSAVKAKQDFILTGCYDNTVRIWNTEGELLLTIPGHSGPVKCVEWVRNEDGEPQKQFLTGSHDETVLFWQWNEQSNSLECVNTCRGHGGSVDCLAINPDATRFCSGSWDKMLKIWSAVPQTEENSQIGEQNPAKRKRTEDQKTPVRVPLVTLSGHTEGISSVKWLSRQEVLTASWDHTIRIWDMEQTAQKSTITGSKVFLDVSLSPHESLLVTASADRHIRLYDPRINDGAVVKCTFSSHTAWVSGVAWSPTQQHQFLSGSYDSLLKLWDIRSPSAALYDMSGHTDKILAVDWTMPQYLLSGGADNHVKIFRSSDYSLVRSS